VGQPAQSNVDVTIGATGFKRNAQSYWFVTDIVGGRGDFEAALSVDGKAGARGTDMRSRAARELAARAAKLIVRRQGQSARAHS